MEAIAENKVNLKEIENDLRVGLLNANNPENSNQGAALVAPLSKPGLNLGSPLVKVVCRIKNGFQLRMVTKNMPEDVKAKLQHFGEVKDNEVVVYKTALDQYGTEFLTSEMIEMINKYANSPLAPLVEFEIEKFNLMKVEVEMALKNHNREGEK